MTKPAPAQETEWVVVPAEATVGMIVKARDYGATFGFGAYYKAALAAAPNSGMVAVPREIAQALAKIGDIVNDAEWAKVHNAADCLRALLSRAGNKGDGRCAAIRAKAAGGGGSGGGKI